MDTQRAIRTTARRRELVDAVVAGAFDVETDWLEWKGPYDLRSKERHATIARHVLGFANRRPERARVHAEGMAFVLLGAEVGSVPGVEVVDSADLESWISRWAGTDGPRWAPHYVDVEGKRVLLIAVEPPEPGEMAHVLQRTFGNYPAGQIFVRRHGKTEIASPEEVRMLFERHRASPSVPLAVELALEPSTDIRPIGLLDSSLEDFLSAERVRLMVRKEMPASVDALTAKLMSLTAEKRSWAEYEEEVDQYIDDLQAALPGLLRRNACRARLGVLQVELRNLTDENFPGVKVDLELPLDVEAYEDEDDVEDTPLPTPPAAWGSGLQFGLMGSDLAGLTVGGHFVSDTSEPLVRCFNSFSGCRVTFTPVDLRPRHHVPLPDVHLVVGAGFAGKSLDCGWSATSTGVRGVTTGSFSIAVATEVVPADLLRRIDDD